MTKLNWWTGSNGNLFADGTEYRYAVGRDARGYWVTRNGQELATGLSTGFDACATAQADADSISGHAENERM